MVLGLAQLIAISKHSHIYCERRRTFRISTFTQCMLEFCSVVQHPDLIQKEITIKLEKKSITQKFRYVSLGLALSVYGIL